MRYVKFYESPVGRLAIITDGEALKALLTEKEIKEKGILQEEEGAEGKRVFALTSRWLDRYFAGKNPEGPRPDASRNAYMLDSEGEELVLRPEGSCFRHEVWEILCGIPRGKTITYGEIAKKIAGKRGIPRMSAQAVGGAVGHNPISIIIPCHRVMGEKGNLTGYGGGISVKMKLLELEGTDVSGFTIPRTGTKL